MAHALLSNDKDPAGVAAVTLPIPDGEYSNANQEQANSAKEQKM